MKTIKVEVEIDAPEKKDFGSQWKDGKTMVFLKPTHPFFGGVGSQIAQLTSQPPPALTVKFMCGKDVKKLFCVRIWEVIAFSTLAQNT